MCCACSCKEATGRPARFALLTTDRPTVPPSECGANARPNTGRRRKAPRSSEATSEGGVFSSRSQPSLQKLHDLNTEIDSYPKYALPQAKTLTDFKPFTQCSSSLWKEESRLRRKCSGREVEQADERENRVRRAISRSTSKHSLEEGTPGSLVQVIVWSQFSYS